MGNCCCNPERSRRMILKSPGYYTLQGSNVWRVPPKGQPFQVNKDNMSGADCVIAFDGYMIVVDHRIMWLRKEDGVSFRLNEEEPEMTPMPPLCNCGCKAPSIPLPSIKGPSISLPSVSLPSVSMPSIGFSFPKIEHDYSSWSSPSDGWGGTYLLAHDEDEHLFMATNAGNLWVVRLEGEKAGYYKQLNTDSTWYCNTMAWCKKLGKLIIASSKTNRLYSFDTVSCTYEQIDDEDWSDARAMVCKGDDAYVACSDGFLYKVDLSSRECKQREKAVWANVKLMWKSGDKFLALFPDMIAEVDLDDGSCKKAVAVSNSVDEATYL
jgi:hypothetical protein